MNIAIRIIAASGNPSIITSPDDALDCLSTLLSNVKETRNELRSLGLIKIAELDKSKHLEAICNLEDYSHLSLTE